MDEDEEGLHLIEGYAPYIADVPLRSYAEPFQCDDSDGMTEEEYEAKRRSLAKLIKKKEFHPPVALADYCTIARDKWEWEAEKKRREAEGACCALQ